MKQLSLDWLTGTAGSQRWNHRRDSFILPASRFNPARAEVVPIPEKVAKEFVIRHHYSGSYPVARFRVGLMVKPPCATEYLGGVAVFSVPMQSASIPRYLACDASLGVELGRLVLLADDYLGFNAESWFVARAFRLLSDTLAGVRGVISYTDPVARYTMDGEMVKPGHAGTIYRALNATYHGRSAARSLILAKDGRVISERALSKIRRDESGAAYACRQLIEHGAPLRLPFEGGKTYVDRVLDSGAFRRVRHAGNHVFSWRI
jgi:hypothetical protein